MAHLSHPHQWVTGLPHRPATMAIRHREGAISRRRRREGTAVFPWVVPFNCLPLVLLPPRLRNPLTRRKSNVSQIWASLPSKPHKLSRPAVATSNVP